MSPHLHDRCSVNLAFPYHHNPTAAERLDLIAQFMEQNGYDEEYYLSGKAIHDLEEKLSKLFGKQATAWFPSGTMAQGIAGRLYADQQNSKSILLHPTSHLLLHEEGSYSKVHELHAVQKGEWRETLTAGMLEPGLAAAIIEMPQRHSGGKLPSWKELAALKKRAKELDIPLHMDGARIWSARPYYNNRSYREIADGFSSLYISLYKDIGAISGAALLGDQAFIDEAKTWRARMGGLLPGAWVEICDTLRLLDRRIEQMPTFVKHAQVLAKTTSEQGINLDPTIPHVNMFHILLPLKASVAEQARDHIAQTMGIWLGNRFWDYEGPDRCAFELTIGEKALDLPPELLVKSITEFMTFAENLQHS